MPSWNVEAAATSLTRAFFDDPTLSWLQPDPEHRDEFCNWFFTRLINYGLRWGDVLTDRDGHGAAILLSPSNPSPTFWRLLRTGWLMLPLRLGLAGFARFNALDDASRKLRRRLAPYPHWYVQLLGVDPAHQYAGLGTALLGAGTDKADLDMMPSYLQTMIEDNVIFYEKREFFIVGEAQAARGGPHIWMMRRDP